MNILMTGPGRGQNMKLWLDYFENSDEHNLYFLSEGPFEFKQYKRINVIGEIYGLRKEQIFFNAYLKIKDIEIDVVHVHGAYYAYWPFYYFNLFESSVKVINIWNEKTVEDIINGNMDELQQQAYDYALEKCDAVLCNWWGSYNRLYNSKYKNKKLYCIQWGIEKKYLDINFTEEYINKIRDKYKINKEDFVICSTVTISENRNIDKVLYALAILKEKLPKDKFSKIKFIIQNGNTPDEKYADELKKFILKANLEENVIVKYGEFLEYKEILALHKISDVEFIILSNDQLTDNIPEALFMDSKLFLSNIQPYRLFNEKFKFNVPLIEIDPNIIANCINDCLSGKNYDANIDKNVLYDSFCLENNIEKVISMYKQLKEQQI